MPPDLESTVQFYDALAPFYHLLYPDWNAAVLSQGKALVEVIRTASGEFPTTVLDAACGIGTQSLGLALLGLDVTASDVCPAAVERAKREAEVRELTLPVSVADMRGLHAHHGRQFGVVLACDNAFVHLLSDEEILKCLKQLYQCTEPGGLCLLSAREYTALDMRGTAQLHPYGVHETAGGRIVPLQVWKSKPPFYEMTYYFIEHCEGSTPATRAMSVLCNPVPGYKLLRLMDEAGFRDVRRVSDVFFQPVIVGKRKC